MKSYNQFCPVAKAADIFCRRWTALILRDLSHGATRFSDLQRGVPLASPTLLARRLRELEAEGVIERRKSDSGRSWTYHLTDAGQEFAPIVHALGVWGQRWSRRELRENEKDIGLLLWSMERGVRPDAFDNDGPTVVQLEFRDQPAHKQRWWFLNEDRACQLCVEEPGLDVGLYLSSTLDDMIYLWRGDIGLHNAVASNRLTVHGSSRCRRRLPDWLALSDLTKVKPAAS